MAGKDQRTITIVAGKRKNLVRERSDDWKQRPWSHREKHREKTHLCESAIIQKSDFLHDCQKVDCQLRSASINPPLSLARLSVIPSPTTQNCFLQTKLHSTS